MEIALTLVVGILSILLGVVIIAYDRLRARTRDTPKPRDDSPERCTSTPGLIATANDEINIPADLVGPRRQEALEHFAPAIGLTPADLLLAVLVQGLVGNRPHHRRHPRSCRRSRRRGPSLHATILPSQRSAAHLPAHTRRA